MAPQPNRTFLRRGPRAEGIREQPYGFRIRLENERKSIRHFDENLANTRVCKHAGLGIAGRHGI
jgi:hypothetical protein